MARKTQHSERRNPREITAELLTLLFKACGVDVVIEEANIEDQDVDETIRHMVAIAVQGKVEEGKDKGDNKIQKEILQLWATLVQDCEDNLIKDQVLMDKCIDYIVALACTPPRNFRLVASISGLQMMTSLVRVAKSFGETRETLQRQLSAEEKKKKKGTDSARAAALTRLLSETHEKITVVNEMIRNLFKGLFMHRYRDVFPSVRAECIGCLGHWIVTLPSLFLQDLYLKYLGWTLNDKDARVRLKAVTSLHALYREKEHIPAMELFTGRFSGRIIELADDVDVHVAEEAIQLLGELLRFQLLNKDEIASIKYLLVDESFQIRQATGTLIHEHFLRPEACAEEGKRRRKDTKDWGTFRLLQIVEILQSDAGLLRLCFRAVDALWHHEPVLQDWKCFLRALLSDEVGDSDQSSLLKLLAASAKRATEGKAAALGDLRKAQGFKSQKETLDANKQELTACFMKSLPKLIRKFIADKEKLGSIMEIILQLDMKLYALKRQEANFVAMLSLLKESLFKHGEDDILHSTARALCYCLKEGQAELREDAQQLVMEIGTELTDKIQAILKAAESDDDAEYTLTIHLRRAYHYQTQIALHSPQLIDTAVDLLDTSSAADLDDEVVRLTLLNIYCYVLWAYHLLEGGADSNIDNVIKLRDKLLQLLEAFIDTALERLPAETSGPDLMQTLCYLVGDTWKLFSPKAQATDKQRRLSILPHPDLVDKYWRLCEAVADSPVEHILVQSVEYTSRVYFPGTQLLYLACHSVLRHKVGVLPLCATPQITWPFCAWPQSWHNIGQHAFHNATAEELEEEEPSVSRRDAIVLSATGLVLLDVVHKDFLAPAILSRSVQHGALVAEAVKLMVAKFKGNDEEEGDLYIGALKKAFERHREEIGDQDDTDREQYTSYVTCKELATRLASQFAGFTMAKTRPMLLRIVTEGVAHAFADLPSRLSFLEAGVIQFVPKLGAENMQQILADARRRASNIDIDEDPHAWRPFINFSSLIEEKLNKAGFKEGPAKRRGRPRKAGREGQRKRLFADRDSGEEEGDDMDEGDMEETSHEDLDDGEEAEDEAEDVVPLTALSSRKRLQRSLSAEQGVMKAPRRHQAQSKRERLVRQLVDKGDAEGDDIIDSDEDGTHGTEELFHGSFTATEEQLPI
eukprot:SM000004S14977  [mRNA]  locus=s4:522604:529013:- [translate_table: standard]